LRELNKDVCMTEGPLFGRLWIYVIPIMLSGILQLLYNAADVAVVGNYAADKKLALAAVGSTGALTNLVICLFVGLSVGTNVVVSRYIGKKEYRNVSGSVHTSMLASIIFGAFLTVVGIVFAEPLLKLMDTPEDVLPLSATYMRIYFTGMTASMAYNFGSAILRSKGDTRFPFIVLVISGAVNVVLNLITVIVFHLDVAGVALATMSSQVVSAIMVIFRLCTVKDCCRLEFKKLKIHHDKLIKIAKVGIPAGFQSLMYCLSNVFLQSAVNSLGPIGMAGNTAASNVDGFIYIACNAPYHAAVAFTGQNYGAKKFARIRTVCFDCCIIVLIVGLLLGAICFVFQDPLLRLYAPDTETESLAEARAAGSLRIAVTAWTYFICGLMDVATGMCRGLGSSFIPMVITTFGSCGLRIAWIKLIFERFEFFHNLGWLFLTYPISWIVTGAAEFIAFWFIFSKICKGKGIDPRHPIDLDVKKEIIY